MASRSTVRKVDNHKPVGPINPRIIDSLFNNIYESIQCGTEAKKQKIYKVKQTEMFRYNVNAMCETNFKHAEKSIRLCAVKRKRGEFDDHNDENPMKKLNTSTNGKSCKKIASRNIVNSTNSENALKIVHGKLESKSTTVTSKIENKVVNTTTHRPSKNVTLKTTHVHNNIKEQANNNFLDEILAGFDCPTPTKSTTHVRRKERQEEQLRRQKTICHLPELSTELFPCSPIKVYSPLEGRNKVVGHKHGQKQTLEDYYINFGRYLSKFTRKYL